MFYETQRYESYISKRLNDFIRLRMGIDVNYMGRVALIVNNLI